MGSRRHFLLLSAVVCVSVVAIYSLHWLKKVRGQVPVPGQIKLVDLTNGVAQAHFSPPQGDLFNFVIGIPKAATLTNSLRGNISVLDDGKQVYRRSFRPDEIKPCNWLDRAGLQGYILTWQDGSNRLDATLQPRRSYSLRIALDQPAEIPVSLWLTFVQSWEAHEKQKAAK